MRLDLGLESRLHGMAGRIGGVDYPPVAVPALPGEVVTRFTRLVAGKRHPL